MLLHLVYNVGVELGVGEGVGVLVEKPLVFFEGLLLLVAFYFVFGALPSSHKKQFLRFEFAVDVAADLSLSSLVAACLFGNHVLDFLFNADFKFS